MRSWIVRRSYDFACQICFWIMTFGYSIRFAGQKYMPRKGPVLVIANHTSFLDTAAAGLVIDRYAAFLARETLFRNRFFGPYIRFNGAIPIDLRGSSREGLAETIKALEQGKAVLMFPEGERSRDGKMQPLKPGLSLLFKRVPCQIVPVGIAGTYEALSRKRKYPRFCPLFFRATDAGIGVSVGPPIDSSKYASCSRQEMLTDLQDAMQKEVDNAERIRRKKGS
jgi:1-acyl-sn-glycerol-3-phosphate acyltransferase